VRRYFGLERQNVNRNQPSPQCVAGKAANMKIAVPCNVDQAAWNRSFVQVGPAINGASSRPHSQDFQVPDLPLCDAV
jgi:hypothetical protein